MTPFDAVVVGAGFGGLAAALRLAERGARVALCETLAYPGGCATTFTREGHAFEAGATLFAGLGPGQLLGDWIATHRIAVTLDWPETVVELRAPGLTLAVPARRDALVARLAGLDGAPVGPLRDFFATQGRVADLLWPLLERPERIGRLPGRGLGYHLARLPGYARLLPLLGLSLGRLAARHGADDFAPLRLYLNALCQITVQCPAAEAEAPFALAALDYPFRGTGHVVGGIGQLAWGLASAVRSLGGETRFADRVHRLAPAGGGWRLRTRTGEIESRLVVANLQPRALAALLAGARPAPAALERLARRVETGWGAAMLYLVLRAPAGAAMTPIHLELVDDPRQPLCEGNHVFLSIVGHETGPDGGPRRTATASTHIDAMALARLPPAAQAERVARVQERMRRTIQARAPEWARGVEHELTASPRTFARFTGRPGGLVGGIPRRAGLASYRDLAPPRLPPGLFLAGDTVFPGQSVLATAAGGWLAAERAARYLGLAPAR